MYYKLNWKMKNGEERTRIFTTMKEQEEAIDIIEARTDVDKASIYQQSSESEFKIFLHPELITEEDQEETKIDEETKKRAAEILNEIIKPNENEKIKEKIKHDLKEPQPKRTEAQKKAEKKYLEKFEDIKVRVPKGMKERIKQHAQKNKKSMNEFIIDLIEEELLDYDNEENKEIEEENKAAYNDFYNLSSDYDENNIETIKINTKTGKWKKEGSLNAEINYKYEIQLKNETE